MTDETASNPNDLGVVDPIRLDLGRSAPATRMGAASGWFTMGWLVASLAALGSGLAVGLASESDADDGVSG